MSLPTLKITAEHVKDGKYVGPNVSNYLGHIEIAENLGRIFFAGSIVAKGQILAKAGTGIEAGDGIKAGWGIKAGSGIKAGDGIEAGFSISCKFLSARLRIFAGLVNWRLPIPAEMEIRAEICGGTVALGNVVAPVEQVVS